MKAHQKSDTGLVAIDENAAKIEALKNGAEFQHKGDFIFSWFISGREGDYYLYKLGAFGEDPRVLGIVSSVTNEGISYEIAALGERIYRTINLSEISFIK